MTPESGTYNRVHDAFMAYSFAFAAVALLSDVRVDDVLRKMHVAFNDQSVLFDPIDSVDLKSVLGGRYFKVQMRQFV